MTSQSQLCVTLVVALCVSLACGQATQCSQSHTQPKLRFVAQLSVNGCPIFVHDTGATDGPHLAVEPLMCVMQGIDKVIPRYDPVIQKTYVSLPVMLRDDAMLTEVQRQLQYLSPKSVKFTTVSHISVSTKKSSAIHFLEFYWSSDESSGTMSAWIGKSDSCKLMQTRWDQVNRNLRSVAVIRVNGTSQCHNYSLMMQNHSLVDPNIRASRYLDFPTCDQLRFVRSIHLTYCTARVHQRLDIKGNFLIEPLLCPNITSLTKESVMYDHIRGMYYLKLDVVLQDDITLNAVKRELADLSPFNVSFMQLWRAEILVASMLSSRFDVGQLMVSGDWRSGQIQVYCRSMSNCEDLRLSVKKDQSVLWRHIKWNLTSILNEQIFCKSIAIRHSSQVGKSSFSSSDSTGSTCTCIVKGDNRRFVIIQQRLTGNVSFQRGWTEYETGFGDYTDFWIGLSTIHSLSINGVTLRVEMKLMNGRELHQEYAGFKVGDASTNYRMTCGGVIVSRSSDSFDAMAYHSGMQFSTMDRDNDGYADGSCSTHPEGGNGGWWFKFCIFCNPNHAYGSKYMWHLTGIGFQPLREIRLMLQI